MPYELYLQYQFKIGQPTSVTLPLPGRHPRGEELPEGGEHPRRGGGAANYTTKWYSVSLLMRHGSASLLLNLRIDTEWHTEFTNSKFSTTSLSEHSRKTGEEDMHEHVQVGGERPLRKKGLHNIL